MRIARFTHDGAIAWGFVEGEDVRPVPVGSPSLVDALTAGGLSALGDLRAEAGGAIPLANVRLRAPIERPGMVLCVGLNYREHVIESGAVMPEAPLLFAKYPTAVSGPYDPIVLPPAVSQVDWEAELAVVIGTRAFEVEEGDALDHVAGYMVANDVSARDAQAADGQWVRAKSYTTFCPLGPWLTTVEEVGDGSGLDVTLRVNDQIMQHGNTADLVADVRRIVSYASKVAALEPGWVLLTGTPAGTGIGMTPPTFLSEGDVVHTSIAGLGSLTNRVVAKRAAPGLRPDAMAGGRSQS